MTRKHFSHDDIRVLVLKQTLNKKFHIAYRRDVKCRNVGFNTNRKKIIIINNDEEYIKTYQN